MTIVISFGSLLPLFVVLGLMCIILEVVDACSKIKPSNKPVRKITVPRRPPSSPTSNEGVPEMGRDVCLFVVGIFAFTCGLAFLLK